MLKQIILGTNEILEKSCSSSSLCLGACWLLHIFKHIQQLSQWRESKSVYGVVLLL